MSIESPLIQVDRLLQKTESLQGPERELFGDTIRALMALHADVLSRMMNLLGEYDAPIIDSLLADDMVNGMLLLYDLHPHDLPTRVNAALAKVRPYLASHGGNVELLGISSDGIVRLAMQGSCHGCPSSAQTLKSTIEQAIYEKAPDVTAIELQDITPPPPENGFVPLERLVSSVNIRKATIDQCVPEMPTV